MLLFLQRLTAKCLPTVSERTVDFGPVNSGRTVKNEGNWTGCILHCEMIASGDRSGML